jgi:hypothetical protein
MKNATNVRCAVKLVSGEELSVQASTGHYCIPRNNRGPYTHVEVGLLGLDIIPPELERFREVDTNICPYVPADVVARVIAIKGGIVSGKTPPLALSLS